MNDWENETCVLTIKTATILDIQKDADVDLKYFDDDNKIKKEKW